MPIRRIKQQSDRGSIKDIQNGEDEKFPPTAQELRLKGLYELGLSTRDEALLSSLGFIAVTSAPTNPVSWYRHKELVEKLASNLGAQLEQTKQELSAYFDFIYPDEVQLNEIRQKESLSTILQKDEEIVKTASADSLRSFRRVK